MGINQPPSRNYKCKPKNKYRTCPHCPKCFVRMFNNGNYEYRCGICGKIFCFGVTGYPPYQLVEKLTEEEEFRQIFKEK